MSLSFEQFSDAMNKFKRLNERINKIFSDRGLPYKNMLCCDHYGVTSLFGIKIDLDTTDSDIAKIINIKDKPFEQAFYERPDSLDEIYRMNSEGADKLIDEAVNEVWKLPFFHSIDKAKVLILSYPTSDRGVNDSFPHELARHRISNLSNEEIYESLYDYAKEPYWRYNHDLIFSLFDFSIEDIVHIDATALTNEILQNKHTFEQLNFSFRVLYRIVEMLSKQLRFILIDGDKNKRILEFFLEKDYVKIGETSVYRPTRNQPYELAVYRHKSLNLHLIHCDTSLYGKMHENNEYVLRIQSYISDCIKKVLKEY